MLEVIDVYPDFERALAFYCAPTLAGLKPASLMACAQEEYPTLERIAVQYAQLLRPLGLSIEIVCRCAHRYLVLIYREKLLRRRLQQPEAAALLRAAGYPAHAALDEMLARLKRRMAKNPDFPHEIGVFLGYPLADVRGFQQNQGKNYKLCKYWKVYADVARAQACFDRYDRCRERFIHQLAQGKSLTQLLDAA